MDESCSDSLTIITSLSLALAPHSILNIACKILFHLRPNPRSTCIVCYTFVAYTILRHFFLLFTALPLETSYEYHEKRRYMYYTLVIVFDTRFKNRISIRRLFSDFYHGLESLRLHNVRNAAHGFLPLFTKMLMLN